jgi:hypothetical protein
MDEQNDHLLLIEELETHGYLREHSIGLLTFLEAPDKLIALEQVVLHAVPVLDESIRILALTDPAHSLISQLSIWMEMCQKICEIAAPLSIKINNIKSKSAGSGRSPLWGYYKSHCFYVALWHLPSVINPHSKLTCLFAHICLAIETLRDLKSDSSDYISQKYQATLALRKFVELQSEQILSHLTDQTQSTENYYLQLKNLQDEALSPIKELLETAISHRKAIRRHRGPTYQTFEQALLTHDQDPDREDFRATTRRFQVSSLASDSKTEIDIIGCHPQEFVKRIEVAQPEFEGKDPQQDRSARQHAIRTKAVSSHIAMSNQRFPVRWETLSWYEVKEFLSFVQRISTSKTNVSGGSVSNLELSAILTAIFWLSKPLKDVLKLKLDTSTDGNDSAYVFQEGHSCWLINADLLKRYKSLADKLDGLSHPVSTCYQMPIHPEFRKIMDAYSIEMLNNDPQKSVSKLFTRSTDRYESAINDIISRFNKARYQRITLKRVETAYFEFLSHFPDVDITIAMLITGRPHKLGATALHYTSYPLAQLQKTALLAASVLCDSPNNAESISIQDLLDANFHEMKTSMHAGSRVCPTRESVQGLVRFLQGKLTSSQKSNCLSINDIAKRHNALTVYTLAMFGFATGYRAVRNPILKEGLIDRATGLAVISDKDFNDNYNSRLVWIPSFCMEQLDLYRLHCRRLRNDLLQISPQLQELLSEENEFLVLLNGKLEELHKVTPKNLSNILSNFVGANGARYILPLNANRHYLRSNLLWMGCPSDVLNVFMGHWELGEEPWCGYSAMNPFAYRNKLRSYLEQFLLDDGWKPIAGFSKGVL